MPVVTYVNTSAEVKAESDICCTSANAVAVVESLGVDRVIFLPDEYLGKYVASQTRVELILWKGHCEVHERFTGEELRQYRQAWGDGGIQILAHPECPPDVLAEADFVGSTAAMIRHVGDARPRRVVMVTECSMSDNVAVEYPDVEFVRPCQLCPHMKRITLPKILWSLQNMQHEVHVDPEVGQRGEARARTDARRRPAGRGSDRASPVGISRSDVLVVGSGAAGLTAALGLRAAAGDRPHEGHPDQRLQRLGPGRRGCRRGQGRHAGPARGRHPGRRSRAVRSRGRSAC